MTFRKIYFRMLSMCRISWMIFIGGIKITAGFLTASAILMSRCVSLFEDYHTYMLSRELFSIGQAVMLLAVLISAIIEDYN